MKKAFNLEPIKLKLDDLIETVRDSLINRSRAYASILTSIKEVGILQPITVCKSHEEGKYKILDGHLRIHALRELGITETFCLVSTDDERFTFDAQINNLNTFQRARMIKKAITEGISPERIGKVLGINTSDVMSDIRITNEIDPNAREILKTSPIKKSALNLLRRVKPTRQIEIAKCMVMMNKYSFLYAKGLVLSTPASLLVKPRSNSGSKFFSDEVIMSLSAERTNMDMKIKEAEYRYNSTVYEFTTITAFLRRLLKNEILNNYLSKHFSECYENLIQIVKMNNFDE